MNYIKQDLAFEQWCENNYLPILSYVIWRKLFKRFNRLGWCEWVTVDNLTLMAESQIKSEATFITYRDELIKNGLVEYEKGRKMSPNRYKMTQLYDEDEKYTSINEVKIGDSLKSKSEFLRSQSSGNFEVNNGSLLLNINKLKRKTKTHGETAANAACEGEFPNKTDKAKNKFIPPTLEEITAYCQERGNTIDPEEFMSHYVSNGWKVGSNPMSDWKGAVIGWEKRRSGNAGNQPANDGENGGFTQEQLDRLNEYKY